MYLWILLATGIDPFPLSPIVEVGIFLGPTIIGAGVVYVWSRSWVVSSSAFIAHCSLIAAFSAVIYCFS